MAAHAPRSLPPPITVSMAFVRGLLSGPQRLGEQPHLWLQRAGIAPALWDQPGARVTADQYIALFRTLIEDYADEGLGLFSRRLGRGSLALMTRAALGAGSVEAALHRVCKSFNLLQDDVVFSLQQEGTKTVLRMAIPADFFPERAFLHEMLARILLRIAIWLRGARLESLAFDFAIPAPAHAAEYERLFPGRVRFEQPCTALWFERYALAHPLRRDEAALREFLLQTPEYVVRPRRNPRSTATQVRSQLEQARPRWLDLDAVAQAMHLSASTLQRRLMLEGTSFQAVKDQLRRDLAIAKLISSRTPVATLATELGFSDSATFQRAFKTWTGSPPGSYRQGLRD